MPGSSDWPSRAEPAPPRPNILLITLDTTRAYSTSSWTLPAHASLGEGGRRPFFLFLNYYDPHVSYADPEGRIRRFLPPGTLVWPPPEPMTVEYRDAAYDAEVLYMDRHLGRLLTLVDAETRRAPDALGYLE